jgi:ABC-type antimicrobial peptide transport system permease subunit
VPLPLDVVVEPSPPDTVPDPWVWVPDEGVVVVELGTDDVGAGALSRGAYLCAGAACVTGALVTTTGLGFGFGLSLSADGLATGATRAIVIDGWRMLAAGAAFVV